MDNLCAGRYEKFPPDFVHSSDARHENRTKRLTLHPALSVAGAGYPVSADARNTATGNCITALISIESAPHFQDGDHQLQDRDASNS